MPALESGANGGQGGVVQSSTKGAAQRTRSEEKSAAVSAPFRITYRCVICECESVEEAVRLAVAFAEPSSRRISACPLRTIRGRLRETAAERELRERHLDGALRWCSSPVHRARVELSRLMREAGAA